MSDIEDPEVIADLKLRAATLRDSSRGSEMPVWQPPRVVDRVPCRGRCGSVVEWNEGAEERFEIFNRQLASRMEAPLDKTRILFCERCRARGREEAAKARREQVDRVAMLIREIKGSPNDERHRQIIDELKKYGHPDINGLEQWLRERGNQKQSKRIGRGGL